MYSILPGVLGILFLLVLIFGVIRIRLSIINMKSHPLLGDPEKRVLYTTEDKINAGLEIIRSRDAKPESEKWLQFKSWYPEVSQNEISCLDFHYRRIGKRAYDLAVQVQEKQITQKKFQSILSSEYPELNEKSVFLLCSYALSESR